MPGSVNQSSQHGTPTRVQLDWISDASGDVSGTLVRLIGAIIRVVFIPDGTAAPTANYDVTLMVDGVDVLAGQGANRSDSAAEHITPAVAFTDGTTSSIAPVQVNDEAELVVANAGDTKAGSVIIYLR